MLLYILLYACKERKIKGHRLGKKEINDDKMSCEWDAVIRLDVTVSFRLQNVFNIIGITLTFSNEYLLNIYNFYKQVILVVFNLIDYLIIDLTYLTNYSEILWKDAINSALMIW